MKLRRERREAVRVGGIARARPGAAQRVVRIRGVAVVCRVRVQRGHFLRVEQVIKVLPVVDRDFPVMGHAHDDRRRRLARIQRRFDEIGQRGGGNRGGGPGGQRRAPQGGGQRRPGGGR